MAWAALAVCCALPAVAQVRWPVKPMSTSECDAAYQQVRALAQLSQDRGTQLTAQSDAIGRQRQASCSGLTSAGNNRYWTCVAPFDQRVRDLHTQIMAAYAERDRVLREAAAPMSQCQAFARGNEQQTRAAADAQRQREQQQQRQDLLQQQARQQEQQQVQRQAQQPPSETQQRQAELTRNQQLQQAQTAEQQRREYQSRLAADVQRGNPARANQDMRPAQVVTPLEGSSANGGNQPYFVQTPAMAAQARREARAQARREETRNALATGQALREMYSNAKDAADVAGDNSKLPEKARERATSAGDEARREYLDQRLNPQGYRDAGVDNSVTLAKESNSSINSALGRAPVITQISNDGLSGAGSGANNAMGSLNQSLASTDQLSAPAPSPSPAGAAGTRNEPLQASSQNPAGRSRRATPETACKSLAAGVERDKCVAEQCKLDRFQQHALCRPVPPP